MSSIERAVKRFREYVEARREPGVHIPKPSMDTIEGVLEVLTALSPLRPIASWAAGYECEEPWIKNGPDWIKIASAELELADCGKCPPCLARKWMEASDE